MPYSKLNSPCWPLSENQRERKEIQVLGLCQGTKKAVEHEGDGDTKCNWCSWNGPQKLGDYFGRVGNQGTNRDYPDYSIVEIGQNTENGPGDLRRLKLHWKIAN